MTHYTSIEQSKHLLELGLVPESADMCYPKDAFEYNYAKEPVCHCNGIGLVHPCWSLEALLEAMPKEITDEYDSKGCLGMSTLYNSTWGWVVYYSNADADCQALHEEQGDTLLEAVYNMVVWLLEEGYIE